MSILGKHSRAEPGEQLTISTQSAVLFPSSRRPETLLATISASWIPDGGALTAMV
jgi:hypothetical protein